MDKKNQFNFTGGHLSLVISKAECPYCERHIPLEEYEENWHNGNRMTIKMKCKCKRFIGIASTHNSFVAYELPNSKWKS